MKQERSKRTHELVLDAAAVEFAAHGYLGANVQRVAEHTGLTKGAVYGHFGSKDALAQALIAHLEASVERLVAQVQKDQSPAAGLPAVREAALLLADELTSDVRSGAALRLTVEQALSRTQEPPAFAALRAFIESALQRAEHDSGQRLPTSLLAEFVLILLVGAYFIAPTAREGLSESVRSLWDILLAPASSRLSTWAAEA
ncbi:TetR/AcrR family transcriptional regulator [Streptomyces kunmingensis]|uniref:TetR/AcrR family transcriptional regulator n=1 Tax=Streptomyces kunmingensis TaxID=68225 RepID=A0ABU6CR03_9ACTN|nr:TetR/AcrR family transcriptional regulator [Streptomyces kunmingensis]MEB3967068.1 TetR/AcrR family transcriptional regulator [Streptomyces kunmingensis]